MVKSLHMHHVYFDFQIPRVGLVLYSPQLIKKLRLNNHNAQCIMHIFYQGRGYY